MSALQTIEQRQQMVELEIKSFELEQRRATALSKSAFFPNTLKNDVASAVIIYDLANRMNISVMEVAQSIYIIYGRPSFSTSFLVARLNQSGLIRGSLKTIISEDAQSCKCSAIDAITGEENIGITVTMKMAKAEGWVDKNGSKWVTMPELMLRKRAQSFFIKEFYPQVMFGLQTSEEANDIEITTVEAIPKETAIPQKVDLNAMAQKIPETKPKPKPKVAEEPKPDPKPEPITPVDLTDAIEDVEAEISEPTRLEKFFSGRGMSVEEKVAFTAWANINDETVDGFLDLGLGRCEEILEQFYAEKNPLE